MKNRTEFDFSTRTHRFSVRGERREIRIFPDRRSFHEHTSKHILNESLWKWFLGPKFRAYMDRIDLGLARIDHEFLYSDLVYPRLCLEMSRCFQEPLFTLYGRRKSPERESLARSRKIKASMLIGHAGLVMGIEDDILKTAYFPHDDPYRYVTDLNLRIRSFHRNYKKIIDGNVFRSHHEEIDVFIAVSDARWFLSDFWETIVKGNVTALTLKESYPKVDEA